MIRLKRLCAPPTWNIQRKGGVFITRPNPGGQSMDLTLPLQLVVRDVLGHTQTARETRRLLHAGEVFVDGKKRADSRYAVGLFDVVSVPKIKQYYRMMLNAKGKLMIAVIPDSEARLKICKIVGKRSIGREKVQVSLHDGRTLLIEKQIHVGDSIVLQMPEIKVEQVLELKKDAYIYLIKGKRAGNHGLLLEILGNRIIYQDKDGNNVETLKKYAIVVGQNKSIIMV